MRISLLDYENNQDVNITTETELGLLQVSFCFLREQKSGRYFAYGVSVRVFQHIKHGHIINKMRNNRAR